MEGCGRGLFGGISLKGPMKIKCKLSVQIVFRPRCEPGTSTVRCERSKSVILVKCNREKWWRVNAGRTDGGRKWPRRISKVMMVQ